MAARQTKHRTLTQIFAIPAIIAVLSAVGLVSALVGDDIWDGLSWVLLSLPILICVACVVIARSPKAQRAAR